MKCPRCALPLTDVDDIHACLRCNGVFLAAQANETVRRALDDDSHDAAATVEKDGAGRLMNRGAASTCPVCATSMRRFRVGPVDVDTCLEHGSWYDRGELALVREALLEGATSKEVEVKAARSSSSSSSSPSPSPASLESALPPSGLELAREPAPRPRRPRGGDDVMGGPAVSGMPPPGSGGGIAPGAARAIGELRASEHREAERQRHHDGDSWTSSSSNHRHHHHHHDSVDVALDVIDVAFRLFN